MNTEMNLGEAWRKASQDEISKPMKPVPGRIAFLKGLGYLEEELCKIPTNIRNYFSHPTSLIQTTKPEYPPF